MKNKPGPQGPFLLNRLVHFHAVIWHNLCPALTGISSSPALLGAYLILVITDVAAEAIALRALRRRYKAVPRFA